MKKQPLILLMLVLLAAKIIFAQSNELDSVVVTANLIPQKETKQAKA